MRDQYENVTAKKKTITITVADMENAIRPGKSRVLVFTLVSTGACAFFLRPHPWGSHLRSHFEWRGRIVRNTAGWPGGVGWPGRAAAVRQCGDGRIARGFRCWPHAARLPSPQPVFQFY